MNDRVNSDLRRHIAEQERKHAEWAEGAKARQWEAQELLKDRDFIFKTLDQCEEKLAKALSKYFAQLMGDMEGFAYELTKLEDLRVPEENLKAIRSVFKSCRAMEMILYLEATEEE